MADYLVLYDTDSGVIDCLWPAGAANNLATWEADGYIEVDGVIVAGIELAGAAYTPALVLLTDPTFHDAAAPPGVGEVDDPGTPTTATERTGGGRHEDYPYAP